ncbi:hypothetical protein SDC9_207716 [bioreactor metagenome]|uniref:Uncharacterized protein n=1 Tax=bioreactor metagenome TaxID=1076179 RepID=A0A645JK35_9ZZZZ
MEHGYSRRLEQRGDSAAEFADYFVFAGEHLFPVRLDFSGDFDAEFRRVFCRGVDFGSGDQSLGRDAADVEAGSARKRFFHDSGFEAALSGADRRDITAGAGADYAHIKLFHGSSLPDVMNSGDALTR